MESSTGITKSSARDYFTQLTRVVTSRRVAWLVISFGIAVRAAQYLHNRSLWIDEANIALNIVNRSFAELLLPLDNNQAAPLGFLMIERLAVASFGNSEFSLRLLPFIAGVASLFLFDQITRRTLTHTAAPIALAIFAFSAKMIYFSAEVKQYSTDVATAALILLLAIDAHSRALTAGRIALLAITGVLAVWISHPSIFVLAGAGTILSLSAFRRKDWSRLLGFAGVGAVWLLSFAGSYLVQLRTLSQNQALEASWNRKESFMPFPPLSLSDLKWFWRSFFRLFDYPLDISFPHIAAAIFLLGSISVVANKRTRLVIVISPMLFALVASGLHQYPFNRRLLVFIVPSLIIYLAEGLQFFFKRGKAGVLIGILLSVSLLAGPFASASVLILNPADREEMRPVMSYVSANKQVGDTVYLYYSSKPAFDYYKNRFAFGEDDHIVGIAARNEWRNGENEAYRNDLNKLRGNSRVWVLFSHTRILAGNDEKHYFLRTLEGMGTCLDSFEQPGSSSYLFDLSEPQLGTGEDR